MNIENFQRVFDQIKTHPETWDQKQWHCGSTHCFAGWAQVLAGKNENEKTVQRDARVFLDMSPADAVYYFSPARTIAEFEASLDTGYTHDGYDRDGYHRYGYDRDGLDKYNKPKE